MNWYEYKLNGVVFRSNKTSLCAFTTKLRGFQANVPAILRFYIMCLSEHLLDPALCGGLLMTTLGLYDFLDLIKFDSMIIY